MDIKINKLIIASSAIMMTLCLASTASAKDAYVSDGQKHRVVDGFGDCVVTNYGQHFDDCEETVEAEPIVEPPKPKPVVRPKPVVIPKPKPQPPRYITRTLNLNEGGGTNFEFGKATLTASAKRQLNSFAQSVKASNVAPSSVTVVGHTDSVGSEKYNQKLSNERAHSVASYLSSLGIPRNTMQISGRGESQPVASNKTKAGRAQNRRVDIKVVGQRNIRVRQ